MTSLSTSAKVGLAVAGSFAAGWSATPSQAQTVPPKDVWNAFSIGVGAAGVYTNTPTQTYAYDGYTSVFSEPNLNGTTPRGTIEIGKDWRVRNNVFGIYADLLLGDGSASSTASNTNSTTITTTGTLTMKNSASVTGRAGHLVTENLLVYGLLGITAQQYTSRLVSTSSYYPDPYFLSKSGTAYGPTVGLGSEVKLNNAMTLKGEYRFTYLDTVKGFDDGNGTGQTHDHTTEHLFRVVLSLKFH